MLPKVSRYTLVKMHMHSHIYICLRIHTTRNVEQYYYNIMFDLSSQLENHSKMFSMQDM